MDVTTGNEFPIVTDEHILEADGPKTEFGDCDIALFAIKPFKALRNKAHRDWIGRYVVFTIALTAFCAHF